MSCSALCLRTTKQERNKCVDKAQMQAHKGVQIHNYWNELGPCRGPLDDSMVKLKIK